MNKIEVLKQGNQITNQLRDELINLLSMTISDDEYLMSKRAETIKSEIEQRFKYRWNIIIYKNNIEFSFVFSEEFLLELKTGDFHMLAYIIPDQPLTQYEPRRDFGVRKPYYKDVLDPNTIKTQSTINDRPIGYYPAHYPY